MENTNLKIINEKLDDMSFEAGSEGFKVDSDSKANWVLNKIREEKAESERIIKTCKESIDFYMEQIAKAKKDYEEGIAWFEGQLEQYFETVDKKKTKTQEVYKLPSGTLKRKYPNPKFDIDDEKLVKWLKDRQMTDYIKSVEKPMWGEFKKTTNTISDKVVDENGEVVDGVMVVDRPSEFIVEV